VYIQETRRSAREHEEQKEVRFPPDEKASKTEQPCHATPSDPMTVNTA
jgi:hypothetical protein